MNKLCFKVFPIIWVRDSKAGRSLVVWQMRKKKAQGKLMYFISQRQRLGVFKISQGRELSSRIFKFPPKKAPVVGTNEPACLCLDYSVPCDGPNQSIPRKIKNIGTWGKSQLTHCSAFPLKGTISFFFFCSSLTHYIQTAASPPSILPIPAPDLTSTPDPLLHCPTKRSRPPRDINLTGQNKLQQD